MSRKDKYNPEMQHTWETPPTLAIPFPIMVLYRRGVNALKKEGPTVTMRCTEQDKELMETEAAACGMSLSAWVRWCSVQAAREACRIRTGKKPAIHL